MIPENLSNARCKNGSKSQRTHQELYEIPYPKDNTFSGKIKKVKMKLPSAEYNMDSKNLILPIIIAY